MTKSERLEKEHKDAVDVIWSVYWAAYDRWQAELRESKK